MMDGQEIIRRRSIEDLNLSMEYWVRTLSQCKNSLMKCAQSSGVSHTTPCELPWSFHYWRREEWYWSSQCFINTWMAWRSCLLILLLPSPTRGGTCILPTIFICISRLHTRTVIFILGVSVKPGLWTGLDYGLDWQNSFMHTPRLQQLVPSSTSSCFLAVEPSRHRLLDFWEVKGHVHI